MLQLGDLVDKVEFAEINTDDMNDFVKDFVEGLEETLDLNNCILRHRNIDDSNKDVEELLDDLENKLDDLVEPVLSSGFNLYHVLIGAA